MVVISPVLHGGNIYSVAQKQERAINRFIDFSASINPLGLSPAVRRAIQQSIPHAVHYPDCSGQQLKKKIADIHRIPEDSIVLGNGSAELITVLPRALGCRHGLIVGPTFMEFERALVLAGAQCSYAHANKDNSYKSPINDVCKILIKEHTHRGRKQRTRRYRTPIDVVFLCNPNSPTGQVCSRSQIRQLLDVVQEIGIWLVIDEAFVDYCASYSMIRTVQRMKKLIVLRSFTKFHAMPGLRIGYLVCPLNMAQQIFSFLPPWSVNIIAHNAALAALDDRVFKKKCLEYMHLERQRFRRLLQQLPGLRVYPSSTNFLLVELSGEYRLSMLIHFLEERGLLIRDCRNFAGIRVPTIRVAVRRIRENDRLIRVLKQALAVCR